MIENNWLKEDLKVKLSGNGDLIAPWTLVWVVWIPKEIEMADYEDNICTWSYFRGHYISENQSVRNTGN